MKKENDNIKIEFFTENQNAYNKRLLENTYKKIIDERVKILEILEIKNVRKVTINLYDNRENFIKEIEKFYKKYNVPSYCKGTIQNGEIYFLFNTQIEEKTYKYELELRKILHEYIHILYNEYIATPNTRITWLDEGIALNLSRERGKFVKEKYPILKSNIDKINLNNLQHESESFVTDKINGYDVSYLTVKYLMETLSKEEFNKLIRKNEDILKMRKRNLGRSKEIF